MLEGPPRAFCRGIYKVVPGSKNETEEAIEEELGAKQVFPSIHLATVHEDGTCPMTVMPADPKEHRGHIPTELVEASGEEAQDRLGVQQNRAECTPFFSCSKHGAFVERCSTYRVVTCSDLHRPS
ncbi:unnamed protein product [Symbiodinium natans]|uniref:Uncharacterized protein n=1 Tax=Symbiodinium natans TaxID=878477 RepID=A0A812KMW0_9DINO|nr:unnamed protein product [Symbiodinium natans]